MFCRIAVFLLQEGNRVLAPVSAGVKVVRRVIAVIVTEAVALRQAKLVYSHDGRNPARGGGEGGGDGVQEHQ